MTLSTTTNRASYSGNGVTTAFSFPYYFLANADLVVKTRVTATGVETLQTITTHYTVTGAGVAAGGTVTMLTAPATGTDLIIYRDPARTQDLDLTENGSMPADEIEERFDKSAMWAQRLSDQMSRTVRLTDANTQTFDPQLPALLEASKYLALNSAGTAFELLAGTDTGTSTTAAHAALTAAHGVAGAIVGTTDSQTLTNKTIVASSNTITAIANTNIASNAAIAATKIAFTAPTVQKFTSGSGTYTTPAGVTHIRVQAVGGGGGGAGSGTGTSGGSSGGGGATTFGSSMVSAGGGGASGNAANGAAGTGGAASLGTGPIGTAVNGAAGFAAVNANSALTYLPGGYGGDAPFFGGGGHQTSHGGGVSEAGETNTGGGGQGGGAAGVGVSLGHGGGSGGFVDAIIASPSATYAYAVGAAGTAGAAGTSGTAGGVGGSGYIVVWEYYN